MIAFQRYPREIANHNLDINPTPSFDALNIEPNPSPARTARALADAGLSIEEAADAVDYAQSWIRMRSQRTKDDASAHSLLQHFQAARAIPRDTPVAPHIPYAWSDASQRWRPVRTEARMEVDSSLPSGDPAHPTAQGAAGGTSAESTNEAPTAENTSGDVKMTSSAP